MNYFAMSVSLDNHHHPSLMNVEGRGENWRIIRDMAYGPGRLSVHVCPPPWREWMFLPHMSSERVSRKTLCRDDKDHAAGK